MFSLFHVDTESYHLKSLLSYFCRNSIERSSKNVESYDTDDEDNELEEKMDRLLEMFPQLTRTELLEVSR